MISIIIPIYNSARSLKKCVNSVLSQTYKDIEVLLINDGSTDNSLALCREYEKKDSRVVVINKEKIIICKQFHDTGTEMGIMNMHGQGFFFFFSLKVLKNAKCKEGRILASSLMFAWWLRR